MYKQIISSLRIQSSFLYTSYNTYDLQVTCENKFKHNKCESAFLNMSPKLFFLLLLFKRQYIYIGFLDGV